MSSNRYIGLMSGTSLDSIDAVLVEFEPKFQLLCTHNHPLPENLRQEILALTQPGDNEIERWAALDLSLADLFAEASLALLAKASVPTHKITAIGSHGQTLRHLPQLGTSLQAGDPNRLAEQTGIAVVADFRRRDLAAQGQGAPLVPAFHQALFHALNEDRVVINIGGMANLTWLPKDLTHTVIGFDTGPGNVLLDAWIQHQRQLKFDANGAWAASGQVQSRLLQQLLSHPYFQRQGPRSTGREVFHLQALLDELEAFSAPIRAEDVQATLTEFTALSIHQALQPLTRQAYGVYLCGGGSHNTYLKQRLNFWLQQPIQTTAALGLDPDWVEACAFAWLAERRIQHLSGNLPSVTGAKGPRCLGGIYSA